MWQMAQDGQLAKPTPGKYEPANRTNPNANPANPAKRLNADTYGESGDAVSGVSGVGKERPVSWDLEPGESATLEELQDRRVEPPASEWERTF